MQVVRKDKISETVSVYLDGLRIIAAALVYLSHEKRESLTGGFLRPLGSFGHEGVVIFFIVSGFVICHATTGRRDDFRGYCIARLARLWSVVLPALCLTVCLDLAGSRVAPQIYAVPGLPPMWSASWHSLWQFVAPALFVNKFGGISIDPGTNGPFWSLCYEFWYYVAWGVYVYFRSWWRYIVILCLALAAGPGIMSLAPIWILGAALATLLGRQMRPRGWTVAGLGVSIVAIAVALREKYVIESALTGLCGTFGPVVQDYMLAVIFAVNLWLVASIRGQSAMLLASCAGAIKFVAGRSFSLYLYQVPLLFFFGALTHDWRSFVPRALLVNGLTLACVLGFAEVTERKKSIVKRLLGRFVGVAS